MIELREPKDPRIKVTRMDRTSAYIQLDGKTVYTVQNLDHFEYALAGVEQSIAPKETAGESARTHGLAGRLEAVKQYLIDCFDAEDHIATIDKTLRSMESSSAILPIPQEPTEAMLLALAGMNGPALPGELEETHARYKAMLAAAPA